MSKEEREIYMRSSFNNEPQYDEMMKDKDLDIPFKKESISRICRLKSKTNPYIYQLMEKIGKESVDSKPFIDCSYYSKRQVQLNNEIYYLLSNKPSGTEGTIGWVASSEVESHLHLFIDEDIRHFKFTGTGRGYNRPWGGRKNLIVENLSNYKDKEFKV